MRISVSMVLVLMGKHGVMELKIVPIIQMKSVVQVTEKMMQLDINKISASKCSNQLKLFVCYYFFCIFRADEAECDSGKCINRDELCDGKAHCSDGSDETKGKCSNIFCPAYSFRCKEFNGK